MEIGHDKQSTDKTGTVEKIFSSTFLNHFTLDRRTGSVYDHKMNAGKVFIVYCLAGICLCFPGLAAGGTLGRLFLTPEQRSSLEALRLQQPSTDSISKQSEAASTSAVSTTASSNAYVLNGMVMQGNKGYTIWLNGVPYTPANLPANVKIPKALSIGVVSVTVPGNAKAYPLRPGQTLDAATGQVREPYQPGPRVQSTDATANPPAP
jgi:hypothetical protein